MPVETHNFLTFKEWTLESELHEAAVNMMSFPNKENL